MILDFILVVGLVTLVAQLYESYQKRKDRSKAPVKVGAVEDPKKGMILCRFCDEQLPWNAKRTIEGYWACNRCQATVLNRPVVSKAN